MKLLIVEDNIAIAQAMTQALSSHYVIDATDSGSAAVLKAGVQHYDAIILDLNLPDTHGLQVCQSLRQDGYDGPILVLSGEVKVASKIALLDAGADDYLTKPFSLGELRARLRMLLRRTTTLSNSHNCITIGDMTLDYDKQLVERQGRIIKLRRKEFALLECLMQNVGTIVTRDILSNHAWRDNEDPWANTIDVHIKYLRDKVDRPFAHPMISTIHGLGYKLEAPRWWQKQYIRKEGN